MADINVDDLPVGTELRDCDGDIWRRGPHGWHAPNGAVYPTPAQYLPVTILTTGAPDGTHPPTRAMSRLNMPYRLARALNDHYGDAPEIDEDHLEAARKCLATLRSPEVLTGLAGTLWEHDHPNNPWLTDEQYLTFYGSLTRGPRQEYLDRAAAVVTGLTG